jgi:hypothetical protein
LARGLCAYGEIPAARARSTIGLPGDPGPKIPKPLDTPAAAARIIDDLAHWHVHAPAAGDVLAATDIHQRTGASFWAAMILRTAKELGCGTLHSEDLHPGQAYAGVQVRNPFLA